MRCSPRSCRVLLALAGILTSPYWTQAGEGWRWFGSDDERPAAESSPMVEGQPLVHEVSPRTDPADEGDGPRPLARVGQGTSRAFARLRGAVRLPTSDDEPRVVSEYSRQGSTTTSPGKKRRTWFSAWFRSAEPRQPQTAQDFIGLPRPGI